MLCEIERPESFNTFSVKSKFVFKNNEISISLKSNKSNEILRFTIDSAAQISILKPTKLNKSELINSKEKIYITGVAQNTRLETLGTIETELTINNFSINHKFYILNSGFRLNNDGILGVDFLKKCNAKIDFLTNTIELQLPVNSQGKVNINITSEKVSSELALNLFQTEEYPINDEAKYVQMAQEFEKKLYSNDKSFYDSISNDYFRGKNFDQTIARNINISSNDNFLDEFNINMLNVQSTKSIPLQRTNILMNQLPNNEGNKKYRNEIKSLIHDYHDVFYVDGDTFIPTDVYKHQIRLRPNAGVVHIKQFRIPYCDQVEIENQVRDLLKRGIVERSTSPYNSPAFLVKKPPSDDGKQSKRLVQDYKALNSICFDQYFNLPLIDDVTNKLFGSKFFTVLDVRGAFNQVLLHEDSRELTAFSTHRGHYHYRCVPFGIQSGPVAWNFAANIILGELLNTNMFCYVDDMLVHSKDLETHIKLLHKIFARLIKHNIKLKIEKCFFFQSEARYLGFKFTRDGLMADERKTICVQNFPVPKNLKETQRFLGLCSFYRRFVPNFSNIASVLYKLCKKNTPFVWNEKCQIAFEALKQKLITPPVLAYPDMENGIFILMCDASQIAAGAVLNIKEGKNERPIEFFSRGFNEAQSRYHSNELEILALVWAVEWFRVYLYGRPKFFVHTDNMAVKFLFQKNHTKSRIHRWRWALQEYNFEIIHKSASKNCVADSLSRVQIDNPHDVPSNTAFVVQTRSKTGLQNAISTKNALETIDSNNFYIDEFNNLLIDCRDYDHSFYFLDKIMCRMHKELQHKLKCIIDLEKNSTNNLYGIDENRSIIILKNTVISSEQIQNCENSLSSIAKFCLEKNLQNVAFNIEFSEAKSYFNFKSLIKNSFKPINVKVTLFLCKVIELTDVNEIGGILNTYHMTPLGGHMSFERMLNTIKRFYVWPNMRSDIKKFTQECVQCHKNKVSTKPKQPMLITATATRAMETISFDHCGRINPPTPRSNAYILILQCTFTKFCFAFAVPDVSADTTARILVENVFLFFGIPKSITSDCHPSFTGTVFKKINKMLNIKHVFTSPFTPSSNEIERKNRELGNFLRIFSEQNPFDWDLKLPYFVANQNSVTHSSTNFSPFTLMFGRDFDIPSTLLHKSNVGYTYEDFSDEFKAKLKQTWAWARDNIIKRKENNREYYNERNKTKPLELKTGDSVYLKNQVKPYKFSSLYSGPYTIDDVTGENSVIVNKGNKKVRVHKNNLKKSPANKNVNCVRSLRSNSI